MRMTNALASAFTCLILAACGGGGGGSGSSSSGGPGSSSGGGTTHTISLNRSRVDLYAENFFSFGSSEDVDVTFSGAGAVVGTLPGQTQPSWLSVSNAQALSATRARVTLTFNQQQIDNVPQRNSTTLRFATGNANGTGVVFTDLVVTATLDHTVTPSLRALTYVRDTVATPATSVDVATRNATWEASSNSPWLQVSPTSGSGNATLQVTTTPSALPEGDHVGVITVRDTVTQRTRTAQVRLGVDPRRLEVDRRGVALSSTLGRSRLQAEIRVIDTAGRPGRWRLTDDAGWLSANTTQGNGDTVVTLEASDATLTNGMHYATVTIAPDAEPAITNSATVRVGFFVDKNTAIQSSVRLAGESPFVVVADPVRPLIYGLRNTPPDITLQAWNVHTGALVHTVTIPAASFVSQARVSPDGSKLVLAASGESRLIPVALSAGAPVVGTPWQANTCVDEFVITYLNGSEVVVCSGGKVLSTSTGAVVATVEALSQAVATFPASIAVSPDGRRLFMAGHTVANHFLVYGALGFRAGSYSAVALQEFLEPNDGRVAYFDPDGVHVVSRSSNQLSRYTFGQTVPDRTLPTAGGWDLFPSAYGGFYATEASGANWLHYDSGLDVITSLAPPAAGNPLLWALSGDETRFIYRDLLQTGFFGVLRNLDF